MKIDWKGVSREIENFLILVGLFVVIHTAIEAVLRIFG